MATERELKTLYCDNYFDLLEIQHSMTEDASKEHRLVVSRQLMKAETRLTKEEAAAIREKFEVYKSNMD